MKKKYLILTILSGLACAGCIVWLGVYLADINREQRYLNELMASYITENVTENPAPSEAPESLSTDPETESSVDPESFPTEESTEPASKEDTPVDPAARRIDFVGLRKKNRDIYAWILVPGTPIDYPVLQHPEDMDYYLSHNLDGSTGYPGCIYTQRMNNKDWSDFNTVLYGHNMKNGTYFAGLHKFMDSDFFQENRYFYIYTEDGGMLTYEIFAAYTAGDEHLLLSNDFSTDQGRENYLADISSHSGSNCHFLKDKKLTAANNIITLSTCIKGQDSSRYLVQGVLVD